MGEDKLEPALEDIAFGRFADLRGEGQYRYSTPDRLAAMQALALLRVAQELGNLEVSLMSIFVDKITTP